MKYITIEGEYTLNPDMHKYTRHVIPGSFPRRYWDIITVDDEEDLAAYLNGQEDFAPEPPPPLPHVCARCQRPCKRQYKHCYRCAQYLKVKARISA